MRNNTPGNTVFGKRLRPRRDWDESGEIPFGPCKASFGASDVTAGKCAMSETDSNKRSKVALLLFRSLPSAFGWRSKRSNNASFPDESWGTRAAGYISIRQHQAGRQDTGSCAAA